ncbi:MAG TPA: RHS repeat-associated core domain-containing protein [Candidatus Nanoarchaeia archaeon]|nr:RHS repeat-associated core domain-containing protein [Candidatus Nanoarchaeia archaeon]
MRRRSSKGVSVLLIILALAIPIDASLSMNGVLIPEQAVPGALRQLAGSFEEKQVSSTVYIYANGQRVAKRVNGETFYFHNDHLGSAAVVTDSQGNIVEEKRYDPFGMELAGSGKIGYNSKELDRDTELNYYGARYYTADFGRFTTPDTVKGKLVNPQSLNLYTYTLNNPMKYVDPSGNEQKGFLQQAWNLINPLESIREIKSNLDNAVELSVSGNTKGAQMLTGLAMIGIMSWIMPGGKSVGLAASSAQKATTKTIYHYTSRKAAESIIKEGAIRGGGGLLGRNKVWATPLEPSKITRSFFRTHVKQVPIDDMVAIKLTVPDFEVKFPLRGLITPDVRFINTEGGVASIERMAPEILTLPTNIPGGLYELKAVVNAGGIGIGVGTAISTAKEALSSNNKEEINTKE